MASPTPRFHHLHSSLAAFLRRPPTPEASEAMQKMNGQLANIRNRAFSVTKCLLPSRDTQTGSVRKRQILSRDSVVALAFIVSCVVYPGCWGFPPELLARLSPIPNYYINGSLMSSRCQRMYACNLSAGDEQQCSCHPYCYLFDTCCVDVRPIDWRRRALPADHFACASPVPWANNVYDFQPNHDFYIHNTGTLMVTQCPECSNSSCYIDRLCQHPLEQTGDGILSVPVTANINGVTYRNIFCAFCHGENLSDVTEWTQLNITIPEHYGYDALGGSIRTGFRSPFYTPIHDCRRHFVQRCSGAAALSDSDACESGATQYVYDNDNYITYRNWNCSKCNDNPANRCVFTRAVSDYWWPDAPTADTTAISRDWIDICPRRLEAFMSAAERQFWLSQCPALKPADPTCSSYVNGAVLVRLFEATMRSPAAADYGVASDYAWLLSGSGSNASVVCSRCLAQYYPTPSPTAGPADSDGGANSSEPFVGGNFSGNFGASGGGGDVSDAQLAIGGITYRRPFFSTSPTTCYVVVCGEQQRAAPADAGSWAPTVSCRGSRPSAPPLSPAALINDAGNDGGARRGHPLSVWPSVTGVALVAVLCL